MKEVYLVYKAASGYSNFELEAVFETQGPANQLLKQINSFAGYKGEVRTRTLYSTYDQYDEVTKTARRVALLRNMSNEDKEILGLK